MLSAQLIARYQPYVSIFGRYLAHRLSTYPRIQKMLTLIICNVRFKHVKYVITVTQERSMTLVL